MISLPDGAPVRCDWARSDPLLAAYHDEEWGTPEYDSRALWEKLILDGFQAGLSWLTILRKRDAFREAFEGFEPAVIARYGPAEVERLMGNPGIIRSRSKIEATIGNARAYLAMRDAGEDFSAFAWGRIGGKPLHTPRAHAGEIPASSPVSESMSRELKRRGFKFAGPVIVYAWMQATGMIDDHIDACHRCRRAAS